MIKRKALASLFFAFVSASAFAGEYTVSTTLTEEEQIKTAQSLYQRMAELSNNDLDEITTLHTQVIEKCPKSLRAQESCWKLSNLFILRQRNHQAAIDVLEHLLKQYPDTELKEMAKKRLLACYEETGNDEKICAYYEELFDEEPNPTDKLYMIRALAYAKALDRLGKTEDAQNWYRHVLAKDNGRNSLEARAARRFLGE